MVAFKEYKRQLRLEREHWPAKPCDSTPQLWFDPQQSDKATGHCLKDCPVVESCLAYALTHGEEVGVWGGVAEADLHNVRRRAFRTFLRKRWDAESQRAFQGWIRKVVQDKQAKAAGVVAGNRRR